MNDNASRRIMQVIDHLGPGGAQRQFVELAVGLHQSGHELLVIALNDELVDFLQPLQQAGIDVKLIAQQGKFDVQAMKQLYQFLKEFRPSIVQTWLFTADMYARPCAKLSSLWYRYPCKIISSVRSAETDKKVHYVWVDRLLRKLTDAFIVNAAILSETLQARERVESGKISTIYNGVHFAYFRGADSRTPLDRLVTLRHAGECLAERSDNHSEAASKQCLDDRPDSVSNACPESLVQPPLLVAYIGRLSKEKRPELFIKASQLINSQLPACQFLMIGSGDQSSYLVLAQDCGLQDILTINSFTDDIASVLDKIDVLVSCSDYEGCSNTILEAMAANVAVVATDVGGNRELIRCDGGALVPAGDPQAIASAVIDAVARPELAMAAAEVACQRVEFEFSTVAMIDAHESLYNSLYDVL